MTRCAKDKCAAVIGLGDVHQCVTWLEPFKSEGWTVETNPRVVMYEGGHRQKCLWVKRQLQLNVHLVNHYYVVAYRGWKSVSQINSHGPFGFFDKTSGH